MTRLEEPVTDTLRRFVYLADRLQTRRIVQEEDLKSTLHLHGGTNQPLQVSHHMPDEEDLRSYLVDFRMFTMEREPVFIRRIFNLAYCHITPDEYAYRLAEAREQWKESMASGDIAFVINGRALQPENLLDLWINGYYFHSEPEKARKLEALAKVNLTRWLFINVLVRASQLVLLTAQILKVSLRENLVADRPIRGS